MTRRTKPDFVQVFMNVLRSAQAAEANNAGITADQLRAIVQDLADSLVFIDELVAAIDSALGGATWQSGAGDGGGATVQAVLDAIRIDDTPIMGIELERDAAVPNILTIRLIAQPVHVMGRYAAIVDNANGAPADFTADVFAAAAAVMSNAHEFATPAYAGASQFLSLGFATPYAVTDLYEDGNDLAGNQRGLFLPAPDADPVIVNIPGAGNHHVTAGVINAATAGNTWRIVEDEP